MMSMKSMTPLKSDQNGIEIEGMAQIRANTAQLKSDQNGIEIEKIEDYEKYFRELKSDQNGIEMKWTTRSQAVLTG